MVAVVEQLPQLVTTEEAVELIYKAVIAGEYATVAEAVRAEWHALRFTEDDLSFLALTGLITTATLTQRSRRTGYSMRPSVGWGSPHGKKWDKYVALTWPYEAADGQQKPLLDFTDVDLEAFAVANRTMAEAYTRRADWAAVATELLKQHNVTRIRDLPAAALAEVNDVAVEAMGRQQK